MVSSDNAAQENDIFMLLSWHACAVCFGRSLAARAKLFGNRLNFQPPVKCIDAPYFDAPGTMEAPLGYT